MGSKIPDYFSFAIIGTISGPILLNIPLVSAPVMVLIEPISILLGYVIPGEFLQNGFPYFWITLESPVSWVFYSCSSLFYGLIVGATKFYLEKSGQPTSLGRTILVAGLFTHVFPILLITFVGIVGNW